MNGLSKKERKKIEAEYQKLAGMDMPEKTGAVNCYRCKSCGYIIKTINVNDGVTPFMIGCKLCENGFMSSSFYRDIIPTVEPMYEWYRPNLKYVLNSYDGERMHILKGGLLLRRRDKKQEE